MKNNHEETQNDYKVSKNGYKMTTKNRDAVVLCLSLGVWGLILSSKQQLLTDIAYYNV